MAFKTLSSKLVGACAGLALFGAVQANAAIIVTDVTTVVSIPGLTGFGTTGAQMDNMSVTAVFAGGFSETLAWADTGANSGGVSGTGWSIAESGTTFTSNAWGVTNTTGSLLTDLFFDGAPGLTVFDIIASVEVTEGSADGKAFSSSVADDDDVVATYSNVVALTGDLPLGDLFHNLHVDFSGTSIGGARGNFTFSQDTDNDSRLTTDVPAPATLALFGLSLLGLGWSRRKA